MASHEDIRKRTSQLAILTPSSKDLLLARAGTLSFIILLTSFILRAQPKLNNDLFQ